MSAGGSLGLFAANEEGDGFVLMTQSFTTGFKLTEKLGSYTEWFAFYKDDAADNRPEHYFNGGFTYQVTPNFQLDVRAGLGLNGRAEDFFTGVGFAVGR